jgi:hypothetical protein
MNAFWSLIPPCLFANPGCNPLRLTALRDARTAELLRVEVVGEILAGCRRDKLLPTPGGIVKDIFAEDI